MVEHDVAPRARRTWLMILLGLIILAAIYLVAADFSRPDSDELPVSTPSNSPVPASEPAR